MGGVGNASKAPRSSHTQAPATPSRPAATTSAPAPQPVDSFRAEASRTQHLAQPMMSGNVREQGPARALSAAENRRGTAYALADRTQVGLLISRSPQIDSDRHTVADQDRCGGAAVFNALLMSGNPAENARALRQVAHANLSPDQIPTAALDAMEHGTLTAAQASQLQEMTYNVARNFTLDHVNGHFNVEEGTNAGGLQDVVNELRSHGGFSGATVALGNYLEANGGAHWVATVTTAQGTASADSWPRTDGYATAVSGEYRPPNAAPGRPAAGVFLNRDAASSTAFDVADPSLH